MMYEKPMVELIKIEVEDIVRTSPEDKDTITPDKETTPPSGGMIFW